MQYITPKARKTTLNLAIRAANEVYEYKVYLKKLQSLKEQTLKLGLSTVDITFKEKEVNNKIKKLKQFISARFKLLLSLYYNQGVYQQGDPRVFCEAYSLGNGQFRINRNSVTTSPIDQLGTKDLGRGYINLTQVELTGTEKNKKSVIILTPIVLDLQTGLITRGYDEDI